MTFSTSIFHSPSYLHVFFHILFVLPFAFAFAQILVYFACFSWENQLPQSLHHICSAFADECAHVYMSMALSKVNVSSLNSLSQAHSSCPYHFWHIHLFRSDNPGADYFVICRSIVSPDLLSKRNLLFMTFLNDETVFKASLGFYTVCLGLKLLLKHVTGFNNFSLWCGWSCSDLHFIYTAVLLNWSSCKSSPAGVENLWCCYN